MNAMQAIHLRISQLRKQRDDTYAKRVNGRVRLLHLLVRVGRPLVGRLKALIEIRAMIKAYGAIVREKAGTPVWQQAIEQYRGAIRYHLPPEKYYLYAIYNDSDRLDQYIPQDAWWQLLDDLVSVQAETDREIIRDKRASERHFRRHGLPTIPILAEFEGGEVIPRDWNGGSAFPAADLFSKPIDASFGKGARRWLIQPDGRYRTEEGDHVDRDELLQRLCAQSRGGAVFLQPRLFNHPRLEELTGPTLATVRIFTMRPPEGKAEYLIGLIGLPIGDLIASNFIPDYTVIGAPIEPETGQLGSAHSKDPACVMEPIRRHPITGKLIEGFTLPDWQEAVALATRAHDTLEKIALVGWDIGLTQNGPVIIEGNSTPGGDSPQVAHKKAWGATRFPEWYRANLLHALRNRDA